MTRDADSQNEAAGAAPGSRPPYDAARPRITTYRGDDGTTGLPGAERWNKDDLVFDALGDLDELNSYLGTLHGELNDAAGDEIASIQRRLMDFASVVAVASGGGNVSSLRALSDDDVRWLEEHQESYERRIEMPADFVVPGKSGGVRGIDYARALARRAERRLVSLIRAATASGHGPRPQITGTDVDAALRAGQRYLNRLSDYLFILARYFEARTGDR